VYKILLSHPLYKDGMAALENKAELIITNNGKAEEILEQLRLADAFILRIGNIDRKLSNSVQI
jgi:D-3-phosphoglycerate dehydrogenase